MDQPRDDKWAAISCLLGAMLCYSAVPVFLRFFLHDREMDPWSVNALRYSVAAVFWLPVVVVLARRAGHAPPGRSIWRDALVPAAVNLFGQATYGLSPAYVSAPTIGFVIRLSFLFTLLFGVLFIIEERRLARKPFFLAGALLCVAGVTAMFFQKLVAEGSASLTGMTILLLSTMGWGGYAVSVRKWMAGYSARLSFGVVSLYTAAGLTVLMLLFGQPRSVGEASGRVWLLLIVSAFVGITFSHVMYYRAIHRLGPIVASGMLMATPFLTCLNAAIFLRESLTWVQFLGGIGVVAGGVLLVIAQGQVERATPTPNGASPGK